MGDRCWISMRIHKDDVDKAETFIREETSGSLDDLRAGKLDELMHSDDQRGVVAFDQANYGLSSARENLAKEGVRFAGDHGSGGTYPCCTFYSDGEKVHEWETDGQGGMTIETGTPANEGKIRNAVQKLMVFLTAQEAAAKLVDESWKEESDGE